MLRRVRSPRPFGVFCAFVTFVGLWTLMVHVGVEADISEVPYLVSVERDGQHVCAGAIVSSKHVLTAAHCCQRSGVYNVRAGSSTARNGGSLHTVSKTISHINYVPGEVENDIALIEVVPPFAPSEGTREVPVATPDEQFPPGDQTLLCGWGLSKVPTEKTSGLRCVAVQLQPFGACAERDPSLRARGALCVAYQSDRWEPYVVDPGAPLVLGGRLRGVASWRLLAGARHGEAPLGLFADASALAPWVGQRAAAR